MDTISSSRERTPIFPFLVLTAILIGLGAFTYYTFKEKNARQATEYVVTFYPKTGEVKTYDNATHMFTNGKGYASFIYNGRYVELYGDMEVVRK